MSDIRVAAIVEGPTEQTFVENHLKSHLGLRGIEIWAILSGSPGRKNRGGVKSWDAIKQEVLRLLKGQRGLVCTTMFDFYGLPEDWPGRTEAASMPLEQKGSHIEIALLNDLAADAGPGFRRELFIPYIQVHEFEAVLFSDIDKMAEVLSAGENAGSNFLQAQFKAILDQSGQPEAINDNYETCPSRRIIALVRAYRKRLHGPIVASKIGLDIIRQKCPHFGQWLAKLESLGRGPADSVIKPNA